MSGRAADDLLPDEAVLRRLRRLRVEWGVLPTASAGGARAGARAGSSRDFVGVRAYEDGDDLRDLDWAATSRLDRPYVRLYRQQLDASLLLLVDASASMGLGDPPKLAHAAALAGALAHLALGHQDRVGVLGFRDDVTAAVPIGRGRGQWRRVHGVLSSLSASGRSRFTPVSAKLPTLNRLRGLAIVLSDFYPPAAFAAGLRWLAAAPIGVVAIEVRSPGDLAPALAGELRLVDAETGEGREGFVGEAERAAYRAALGGLRADVAALCRALGIRHVVVSTDVPIARCLEQTLVRAGVLGRAAG